MFCSKSPSAWLFARGQRLTERVRLNVLADGAHGCSLLCRAVPRAFRGWRRGAHERTSGPDGLVRPDGRPGSKELQLLTGGIDALCFLSVEQLYLAELLVRDAQNAYFPVVGEEGLHALDVDGGVFAAGAMAQIDGELEHGEAVPLQVLPKVDIGLLVFLCLGWRTDQHQYQQDALIADTFHTAAVFTSWSYRCGSNP